MRRKTFAPNAIIIGVLVGILVYVSTEDVILTAIAAIGVSVVGWIAISWIEKLISRGIDAGAAAIQKGIQNRKENKEDNDNNDEK